MDQISSDAHVDENLTIFLIFLIKKTNKKHSFDEDALFQNLQFLNPDLNCDADQFLKKM